MCGIVGYIGRRDVAPLLLEGLQRLEYRGYDSAGIAVTSPKTAGLKSVKAKGRVRDLEAKVPARFKGTTGIADVVLQQGKPRLGTGIGQGADIERVEGGNQFGKTRQGSGKRHLDLHLGDQCKLRTKREQLRQTQLDGKDGSRIEGTEIHVRGLGQDPPT